MVGAPDIDDAVIAALQFVHVIGDIGGEVGMLAVFTDYDPILLVTEVTGTEPPGAALFIKMPG